MSRLLVAPEAGAKSRGLRLLLRAAAVYTSGGAPTTLLQAVAGVYHLSLLRLLILAPMLGGLAGMVLVVVLDIESVALRQALVASVLWPLWALLLGGVAAWGFRAAFVRARGCAGWETPRDSIEALERGLEYSLGICYGALNTSDSLVKLCWLSFPSSPFLHEVIRNAVIAAGGHDPESAIDHVEAEIVVAKPRTVGELAKLIEPLIPRASMPPAQVS